MEFNFSQNLPLILIVIALGLFVYYVARRRPDRAYPEVARGLLTEVRLNRAILEALPMRPKPRKLEVVMWEAHKKGLDFLGQTLCANLSEAYGETKQLNQRIQQVLKSRTTGAEAQAAIGDTAGLKEMLAKCQAGIEDWLLVHTGRKEPPVKYPSIIDDLFGTGR